MKRTIVTRKTSLAESTQTLLNQQVGMESNSSSYYLAAASWCEKEGYENAAAYLYRHAEEERSHMMKIFQYINQAGGHALAPSIGEIRHHYASLREVFEEALEHELAVTRSINDIADQCFKTKDFATFQFLQWFVIEQREEEVLSRRALELFDVIGEEAQGLWIIDQEIGKLDTTAANSAMTDLGTGI
jgi:ferritin